jgi:site-specific DNA-methyltransferase (adenine-specific)
MRAPYLDDGDVRLYLGDCIEVMREMDADSVDAVVCDPPYGIGFMGKAWDAAAITERVERDNASRATLGPDSPSRPGRKKPRSSSAYGNRAIAAGPVRDHTLTRARSGSMHAGEYDLSLTANAAFAAWCETWAREALRVLKPGGHLLAFGGTRTFHRLTCGIEDAGFEVRDCLSWLYGSGFPKSLDVSKAIDKAAGAEREVVGTKLGQPGYSLTDGYAGGVAMEGNVDGSLRNGAAECSITAPATDAAQAWQGWGTALKPGWEPCVVARKPLAGTVAENVQQHGTGAINVDGCRIPHGDDVNMEAVQRQQHAEGSVQFGAAGLIGSEIATYKPGGRWPANVAFDEQAAAMLDAQSGERPGATSFSRPTDYAASSYKTPGGTPLQAGYADTGGASRFFYTAKASRADRSTNGANNTHPTVKPTDLMRWLVRLVTPPGGVVLDPFAGSGSTLVAARAVGVRCIGIEREDEYAEIVAARLSQLSLFSEAS